MKTDGKGCPGEEVIMKEKSFDPILKSIFRALRMAAVLCAAVFLLHCLLVLNSSSAPDILKKEFLSEGCGS